MVCCTYLKLSKNVLSLFEVKTCVCINDIKLISTLTLFHISQNIFKAPSHHINQPSQLLTCIPKSVRHICKPVSLFFPNLNFTSQLENHTKLPPPKYPLPPTQ